jgi:hypothetical protein
MDEIKVYPLNLKKSIELLFYSLDRKRQEVLKFRPTILVRLSQEELAGLKKVPKSPPAYEEVGVVGESHTLYHAEGLQCVGIILSGNECWIAGEQADSQVPERFLADAIANASANMILGIEGKSRARGGLVDNFNRLSRLGREAQGI